jgi:hypothetical protein
MTRICIVAAMIVIVASPALAQSSRKTKTKPQRAPQATPYVGYSGQPRRNYDPDPNVQFEIMRQEQWRKGG